MRTGVFSISIKDKLRMASVCAQSSALGLFSRGLNAHQSNFVFDQLKEHINHVVLDKDIKNEFQFKLMMSTSEARTFFCILAGWRSSANEAHVPVLDRCIRDFQTLYPEIYDEINGQESIYKPK